MLSLEAREQLHSLYQRLKFGSAEWQDCVSWAIERLQQDDEGDDLDIVLLAAATSSDEVPALFQQIADRHLAPEALNDDLAAGKHLVRLHQAYRDGQETVATLEPQLWRMYRKLRYPDWLTMLAFHCEPPTYQPTGYPSTRNLTTLRACGTRLKAWRRSQICTTPKSPNHAMSP